VVSARHQTIVRLLDERPELLGPLLSGTLAFPEGTSPYTIGADATALVPAELRVDLVVALKADDETKLVLAVEVQLSVDADKLLSWPHYVASLRHRHACPVALVVLAPDREVAKWAAVPIELGPGFALKPVVLGPDSIDPMLDPRRARMQPELSVLSSLVHPDRGDIALVALGAALHEDDERGRIYADIILACLTSAGRLTLEKLMATGNYEYQSDFAKKYLAQGIEQGLEQGLTQALITVLSARGFELDEAEQVRITATRDVKQLERWLEHAPSVHSIAELFEVGP
jgi:hypothetical protein